MRAFQSRLDEPAAQVRIVSDPFELAGGGLGVTGRHEQRGALRSRRHAPDGGGDGRQAGGERLDQHLREALGPGHVHKRVAASVQI